ncbi:NAD(P)/FAD-dependent oxidoreductase [Streptomyces johnsoniae]|uniref:FAD-dependent monooxygenase n=1 Tax=Streptomyces johnsoniae TaxID=3075532 RepID=A0ABU2RWC1_9ACTN|nr:FAD-dependent monooxygenase [Streptomyces sp. DSM 41886]MDT0441053.1 FAD-dependent monooxygenase [Streptomyces sp. DSM 41886]
MSTPSSRGPVDGPAHDVIVLGSGLAAATLAAILARQGIGVVMADDYSRPRLPRGEMLGRQASLLLRMMATRYGVPELASLTSLRELSEATGPTGGQERCHSFLYHRPGSALNPAETLQVSPPKSVPPEPMLYRPHVDAYLRDTAVAHGATEAGGSAVTGVEVTADGVRVTTAFGDTLTGRYLVDAGDGDSAFVAAYGLREEPTRLRLRTRSLYMHLSGVRTINEVYPGPEFQAPNPWHEGSTHHLFDGGYLGVYSFGNRPESTNDTTAVWLNLDADRFPPGASPTAEFRAFLDRYPSISPMFESAERVAESATSARQQYSCTTTVGDRWCVIGEAAGFVDPFLNRSLVTSLELVNAVAWRLVAAARDGDYSRDRFEPVERMGRQLLDQDDRLASLIMASTREHVMWRGALAVMETGLRFGQFVVQNAANVLVETGSDDALRQLENIEYFGSVFPGHKGYNELLTSALTEYQAVAAGDRDPDAAAETVFRWLAEAEFIPGFFVLEPTERFPQLSPADIQRLEDWARGEAPADVGALALTAIETIRREIARARRA